MAKIYTVVNQKGGVGKTTTSINLGAKLGELGMRVLIVDLDPQANATASLGVERHNLNAGTYELLIGTGQVNDIILHHPRFKISLIPSTVNLSGAEIELIDLSDREKRLKNVLDAIADRYDYIIIDCPPSLGLLTLNGLIAAKDGVIIPVQCEYLALEGLGMLTQTLQRIRQNLFADLTIRGVLLTMFDGRTNLSADVRAEVQKFFPEQVFDSYIPRSVRLAEAPSFGMPISFYAPESTGAKAYDALAREVMTADGFKINTEKQHG